MGEPVSLALRKFTRVECFKGDGRGGDLRFDGGEGTATGNEQHRNEDLTVTSREQKEGGGREGVESLEK